MAEVGEVEVAEEEVAVEVVVVVEVVKVSNGMEEAKRAAAMIVELVAVVVEKRAAQ